MHTGPSMVLCTEQDLLVLFPLQLWVDKMHTYKLNNGMTKTKRVVGKIRICSVTSKFYSHSKRASARNFSSGIEKIDYIYLYI